MHINIRTWNLFQGLAESFIAFLECRNSRAQLEMEKGNQRQPTGRFRGGLASVSADTGHLALGTLSANLMLRCSRSNTSARPDDAARSSSASLNSRQNNLEEGNITATVIECPGKWEDSIFEAVQINVAGVKTPFIMTMALTKVSYHALSEFVTPGDLYRVLADAINKAQASVKIRSVVRSFVLVLAAMLLLAPMVEAQSQSYPTKPVRILIPFTAGSQTDLLARAIGPKMSEKWGQQIVVDNRPSAGGIVAGSIVANSTPDGHTLMLSSNAFAVSAALYSKLPYDPLKDFAGVALVVSNPLVLVVSPKLGAKSVKELIALSKSKPGQFNFGSAGIGSGTHMGGEQFKLAAGINVAHVPYRGTPEALIDTITGRIQYWFSPMGPALPFIADGKLLALAVTTAQRSPALRDVATVAEAALPGFDYDMWFGVLAPARTPHLIVAQLSDELARIVGTSEIRDRMQLQGVETKSATPEVFTRLMRADIMKLRKVVNAAGIKVD